MSDKSQKMRITNLKNGYVEYPENWIVLKNLFGSSETCLYAGVVEARNSTKYGIPHFLFFSDKKYAKDYSDEMELKIFEACKKAWPAFEEFEKMERPLPDFSDQNEAKKWDEAPCIHLFHIIEKGDPIYDQEYDPPYGAQIIRSND